MSKFMRISADPDAELRYTSNGNLQLLSPAYLLVVLAATVVLCSVLLCAMPRSAAGLYSRFYSLVLPVLISGRPFSLPSGSSVRIFLHYLPVLFSVFHGPSFLGRAKPKVFRDSSLFAIQKPRVFSRSVVLFECAFWISSPLLKKPCVFVYGVIVYR